MLDVYCGSGALALEALSRRAACATFLDRDRVALAAARANAESLGETEYCTFLLADAGKLASAPRAHALAFLDPPYGKGLAGPVLGDLAAKGWLAQDAICVVERGAGEDALDLPAEFLTLESRRYGAATIEFIHYQGPRAA